MYVEEEAQGVSAALCFRYGPLAQDPVKTVYLMLGVFYYSKK